jgi:hypothetical protein
MIFPERTLSLTKWQSISMRLVHSWKTELEAICSATWLSHISFIVLTSPNCSCWSNCLSHVSSHVVVAIARYSAFALDLASYVLFLAPPWDQISSNENTIPWSGPSIYWWTCPIGIRITHNLGISLVFIK